jgi:hypothetical protein
MSARRLAKLALSLGVALVALELALHLAPGLLPPAYLARFPGNGTEFFHPGILARTPVEGVLLPHLASAHHGPPPADLVELGLAPAEGAAADAREFPVVELPADALGFPNAKDYPQAELVLVGDSFGVAAGARAPEGLQAALERATGLRVCNLSLAGVGPVQERWLVETQALARAPRAVLWLYYSGNDLTASYEPLLARRDGHGTWAEAWPERAKPSLYLPGVLEALLRPRPAHPQAGTPEAEPLPGFAFPLPLAGAGGGAQPVWFEPETLRQCGWTRAEWEAHPVWAPVQAELRAARDACAARGARLLLVYLPSKPELWLPLVPPEPELARRTIGFLGNPAPPLEPAALYARLLANRHAHEELLRDFCAAESIPFLSATPALEAQAARGELGYLAADTHWQARGQLALLEPLLAFLRAQGVLE